MEDLYSEIQVIRKSPGTPVIHGVFFVSRNKTANVDELAKRLLLLAMAFNAGGNQINHTNRINHRVPKSFITLQNILEKKMEDELANCGVVHVGWLKKMAKNNRLEIDDKELREAVAYLCQSGEYIICWDRFRGVLRECAPPLANLGSKGRRRGAHLPANC